jgi:hypothetical protein
MFAANFFVVSVSLALSTRQVVPSAKRACRTYRATSLK